MNRMHRRVCGSDKWASTVRTTVLAEALAGLDLKGEVLEVGPGPGLTTDELVRRGPRVTALELDRRLADQLGQRLGPIGVRVVQGDACAMPFPDASFDAVACFTMLHHVPTADQQDAVLREARRVLRPGGLLVGSDNTGRGVRFAVLHIGDVANPLPVETLPARLEAAGYSDVEVRVARRISFRATAP